MVNGIVRDSRLCRRNSANQRGLAGVGKPEQTHVSDDLISKFMVRFIARQARAELARRTVGAALELGVAEATLATIGDLQDLAASFMSRALRRFPSR